MAWVYIIIGGLFEVVWAVGLKQSKGFTELVPSIVTIVGMVISFGLLSLGLKSLPVGTGYAVWTGVGALGTVIFGIVVLREPASAWRLLFAALLIVSIIGLKFTTNE